MWAKICRRNSRVKIRHSSSFSASNSFIVEAMSKFVPVRPFHLFQLQAFSNRAHTTNILVQNALERLNTFLQAFLALPLKVLYMNIELATWFTVSIFIVWHSCNVICGGTFSVQSACIRSFDSFCVTTCTL